jgi:glycosyltransferase involved in cell wall biosynthesis
LLSSDGIVAMSRQSVAELREVSYPNENILTVPNGIALSSPLDVCGNEKALCRVVFVGRLNEQKRLDTLLSAWQQVIKMLGTIASLELWGNGPKGAELRQQCEQLGIGNSVVFCGHVDNVRERLQSADIFVLPSCGEGNSNAVLEAMDAGLPILATRVGGTSMQVGNEGAALLFDVGDSEALAERLIALIRDPILRRNYSMAMRRRVECYFDIDKVAGIYQAAYASLSGRTNTDLSQCGVLPE